MSDTPPKSKDTLSLCHSFPYSISYLNKVSSSDQFLVVFGCWDKHHPQGKVEYKARLILEALYSMRDIKLSSHLLTRVEI